MKILHVGKYYPPYRGGMETVLQNVAEGLLDAGCEVSLLTAGQESLDRCEQLQGPRSGRRGTLVRAGVMRVINSQPLTPGLVSLLRRAVVLGRPDLVQLHLPNPLAAAAWLGLVATGLPERPPMTIWYHADITRQRLGRRIVQPLITACLALADGVCVSSAALREGSTVLQPVREKVAVIPFGITGEPWSGVEPQRNGPFLFVGRLVRYKGGDILLRAIAQVPGARLVVIGDGPEKVALLDLVDGLGLADRVVFAGTLTEEQIATRLATARALVLPSTDASEAFGLVQLEAMAAGIPVVATDLPTGVPEVGVPGETGFLVAPGDPEALANVLGQLQSDAGLRARLGEAGRRRFQRHYARDVMITRLVAWYGSILGRA